MVEVGAGPPGRSQGEEKMILKNCGARCLAILLVLSFLCFSQYASAATAKEETYDKIKILSQVLHEIQDKYVEDKQAQDLIYGAIKGMVRTLDPHSAFLTPKELKELQVETRGTFTGVGIEITLRDGVLTVVSPIDGTPAEKAGVKAGDQIVKIDGKSTKDISGNDLIWEFFQKHPLP